MRIFPVSAYNEGMTYIEHLDPNSPLNIALDEAVDQWDDFMPGWLDRQREAFGAVLHEGDFPVEPATVAGLPTTEDWEAFAEANWSDPAERGW